MEVATEALVVELRRAGVPVVRVNTADPDDELGNRGKWTFHNVSENGRHLLQAAVGSFRSDVAAVYLPIAQKNPAFVRDALFILMGRLARKPVAVHLHGAVFSDFYRGQRRLGRALVRASVGRATLGIVLSDRLRPALECVLPSERVASVPNGVDLDPPTTHVRRGDGDAALRIAFLSSLYLRKGPVLFVQGFALAQRRCPGLRAIVGGEWADDASRDAILAAVREQGVEETVEFVGRVEGAAKAELLASADVFCFTSHLTEGQPLVIIEAMAAGLPVISTPAGGAVDVVDDGKTGLVLQEATPEALGEAIVRLVDDPELRQRLGAEALRRHSEQYTRQAFGERAVAVLRPLLARD
jgi:glycosyltransferase involved in cell wall biosynthesis